MSAKAIQEPEIKTLFNEIIAAHILFHKLLFENLRSTGLTAGQPKILEFLEAEGNAVQRQIASACGIEPSTAARLLAKMEDSGLIRREPNRENRRCVVVSLTGNGREKARLVKEAFEACEKIALENVEDRNRLLKVFQQIERNLRNAAGETRSAAETEIRFPFYRSLHYQLMECQSLLRKCLFSGLSDTGLTAGQPKVLEFLRYKEGCQQREIAEACLIEPATVTSLLFHMEQADLIERREKNGNRRSLYVYLTDKGRRLAKKAEQTVCLVERLAMAGTEGEDVFFRKALEQIYRNLRQQ